MRTRKHYKTTYQIDFKTLEPFNESFSDYWYAEGSQEGCHFEPESQMKIIRMLYPKLKATGLNTLLSASDETNLRHFLTVQKAYQTAGDIWDKLGQLNTHTYSGTNTEREEVRRLIRQSGKQVPAKDKDWKATSCSPRSYSTTCRSCARKPGSTGN